MGGCAIDRIGRTQVPGLGPEPGSENFVRTLTRTLANLTRNPTQARISIPRAVRIRGGPDPRPSLYHHWYRPPPRPCANLGTDPTTDPHVPPANLIGGTLAINMNEIIGHIL